MQYLICLLYTSGYCYCSLMFCAGSSYTSRQDFTTLGYIFFQFSCILVADLFSTTENTNFSSSAGRSSGSWSFTIIISHDQSLLFYQLNGNSSSMPSGIFIKPSALPRSDVFADGAGLLCCGAEYPPLFPPAFLLSANSCSSTTTSVEMCIRDRAGTVTHPAHSALSRVLLRNG